MPPLFAPNKRMFMGIPVGGGALYCLFNFLPRFKTASFERQRAQDLPPGFDQVQVRGRRGLIDTLPAFMLEHEVQQIVAMMHVQIVQNRVNALDLSGHLLIDKTEKVDEVLFRTLWIALRPAVPSR